MLAVGEVRLLRGLEEQQQLGAELAEALPRGAVLFLDGELGAGKTSLTQGLVQALGFTGGVTSPTYALMHIYPTPAGPVLHVDAYRVRSSAELYEMDLEDLINAGRLSIIEWGEQLYADYPQGVILKLEHQEGQPELRRAIRLR